MEKEVNLEVSVNTEKATDQTVKLIQLLKIANSLVGELADTLGTLELDIKEPCYDGSEKIAQSNLKALEGITYPEWVN